MSITPFTLRNKTEKGENLEAHFDPERGMNLLSYKLNDIEVIDQTTKVAFEQKFAGLGALIGPHFHRRPKHLIPKNIDESKFPHSLYFKNDPLPDCFSHGIGRYAPWQVSFSETSFKAKLSGKDTWNGVPLSELEGQNFEMHFNGELSKTGLILELSVVSDTDSIVGIHYYFSLKNGRGTILSKVQDFYLDIDKKGIVSERFQVDKEHNLTYPLNQNTDFTFFPYPDLLNGHVTLQTETHNLLINYNCLSAENSWQLWHPEGASFVCIEPVSSQNPRVPNLTASSLSIHLQINPPL